MEEREKEMIGAGENQPTEKAIRAHHLGKNDLERARILLQSQKLTPSKARKIIETYATLGDVHLVASKFDLNKSNVQAFLSSLSINSIEDAKRLVRSASANTLFDDEFNAHVAEAKAQRELQEAREQLLEEHENLSSKEEEVTDQELRELKDIAANKNKADQQRLVAEKLRINIKEADGFRIPYARENEFKKLALMSLESARRQFGGTKKQIKAEARRLLPNIDADMLR